MSNTNTIPGSFTQSGTLRNQWPTQTINAATETALLLNTDTGTTTGFVVLPTGGQIYGSQTNVDSNANPAIAARSGREYGNPSGYSNDQFSSSSFDGRLFYVRLAGIGNAGANASQSALVNLYQGTSATLGSDVKIATTGSALAMVAGGAFNFFIEAELQWDATSKILSGGFTSNIAFGSGQQFTVTKALTNIATSVTAPGLSFLASATFGSAQTTNTITVREFTVEAV